MTYANEHVTSQRTEPWERTSATRISPDKTTVSNEQHLDQAHRGQVRLVEWQRKGEKKKLTIILVNATTQDRSSRVEAQPHKQGRKRRRQSRGEDDASPQRGRVFELC